MSSPAACGVPAGVASGGAAAGAGCDDDAGRDDRDGREEVAVQHEQRVGSGPAGAPPARSASDRPAPTGDAAVDAVLRRVRGPDAPRPAAGGVAAGRPGTTGLGSPRPGSAGADGAAPEGAGPDGAGPDGAAADGAAAALAARHDVLEAAHRDLRALLVAEPPDVPDAGPGAQSWVLSPPPTTDLAAPGPTSTGRDVRVAGLER